MTTGIIDYHMLLNNISMFGSNSEANEHLDYHLIMGSDNLYIQAYETFQQLLAVYIVSRTPLLQMSWPHTGYAITRILQLNPLTEAFL